MAKVWFDSETIGLAGGRAKLFQFAVDDGPVQFIPMLRGWESDPMTRYNLYKFKELLWSPNTVVVGFNCAFDWFVAYQTFHRLEGHAYDSPERPIPPSPARTLDLQTHAIRNSPLSPFAFSKGGARSVAAVRRIPRVVASVVRGAVEDRLRPLLPSVCALKCSEHEVPGRKELVTLSWHTDTRLSLKNLMKVYGLPVLKLDEVWPLPATGTEKPWLPYPTEVHDALEPLCDAVLSDRSLPFWNYAHLDIEYLRVLYEKLGRPEPDHHDTCTHAIAYTRYHGFGLDRSVLERTRDAYMAKVESARSALAGVDLASPKQRLAKLREFDPLIASSSKKVIETLANSDRPSAPIAKAMIDFGMFTQRLNQVEKVLECRTGRAHPDFRCMGTRTGRMAGTAGLNWQGIPQAKGGLGIRAAMETAAGGDFSQFEVCIAAAAFPDAAIQEDIDHGVDQHSMNAALMHPEVLKRGLDYATFMEMVKMKDPWVVGVRKKMKPVTFGLFYFCQAAKVAETLGVPLSEGEKALDRYYSRYAGFAAYKREIERAVQTADTTHWSAESLDRFRDECEDMTGYQMRWKFEANVARTLWRLGCSGIRTGRDGTIIRQQEKGAQTYDGAVRSALLGSAIAIQAAMTRQIGNAKIQATGANLTKMLMADLWNHLHAPVICVHDEVQCARHPNYRHDEATQIVEEFVAKWKAVVPSIAMECAATEHWSDK